jgi:hypothetical protein
MVEAASAVEENGAASVMVLERGGCERTTKNKPK